MTSLQQAGDAGRRWGLYLLRWGPLSLLVGTLAGCASALLVKALVLATYLRETHPWLIVLLPLAGLITGLLYQRFGGPAGRGNDLILDTIHAEADDPQEDVPGRMAPLILVSTFLTHLCGGSAGREGTAVQMGASLAGLLGRPFRLDRAGRRVLLMAGMSAGFASVFAAPLAGAVFGIEVLTLGSLAFEGALPCLLSALVGDRVTRAWHVSDTAHSIAAVPAPGAHVLLAVALVGACSGLAATLFAHVTHAIGDFFRRVFRWAPLRPVVGGALVAAAVFLFHAQRYIGLGIPGLADAFAGTRPPYEWVLKLAFTAVTVGAGLKGGEVTPLFFIGATLGSALTAVLPLPVALAAALGMVAVFAGAANTPITSTLVAYELFGPAPAGYAALACTCAYLCSGTTGIYHAQRPGRGKLHRRMRARYRARAGA